MNLPFPRWSILALSVLITGCASARGPATKLSQVGVSVSDAAEANFAESRASMDQYIEGVVLLDGLGTPIADAGARQNFARIAQSYAVREQVFNKLSDAYKTFGDLAAYDAAGEFGKSISDLSEALQGWSITLGAPLSAALQGAGELVITGRQNQKLRAGSRLLRGQLVNISALLRQEQKLVADNRGNVVQGKGLVATELWGRGLSSADGIFRTHATGFGLVFDTIQYRRWATDWQQAQPVSQDASAQPRTGGNAAAAGSNTSSVNRINLHLDRAVRSIVASRVERTAQLEADTYAEMITAINRLDAAHKRFENGQSFTASDLAGNIARLRVLIDQYRKANES